MQLQQAKQHESPQVAGKSDDSLFVRHRGPVTCVAGIPNRNAAVSSAYDGAVAYADLDAGTLELMGYHDHLANKITVNAAGTKAASCSSDYTIYIWDLVTHKLERILKGHSDDVEDFVFVDDGRGVSVSRDWRIIVWNLITGAAIHIIEGHEKDVLSVAVDNGRIYTSGDDMTLRVWDLETGKPIRMWGPFEDETTATRYWAAMTASCGCSTSTPARGLRRSRLMDRVSSGSLCPRLPVTSCQQPTTSAS